MTTKTPEDTPSRLDRIERILDDIATQQTAKAKTKPIKLQQLK